MVAVKTHLGVSAEWYSSTPLPWDPQQATSSMDTSVTSSVKGGLITEQALEDHIRE